MELTNRKKRILRAIVEIYISTAERVGSKAVAEQAGAPPIFFPSGSTSHSASPIPTIMLFMVIFLFLRYIITSKSLLQSLRQQRRFVPSRQIGRAHV